MTEGLASGQRFGDFEILDVAGEGGMGIVYRATQLSLRRTVALKIIAPDVAVSTDFRARFDHESELAASIDHPHVVSIFSAGEHDDQPYIAMQWIDGISLHDALAAGPMSVDRAVMVISQIAGALDVAHTTGLVHRDVKPANILLRTIGGRDHAYLTDFGVAKRTQVGATGLTRTGYMVGTLGYMAPEQLQGQRGDGRSDLYSLGCVLYECLTGRPPFERENEVAVMWAHVNDPRPRPSDVRPDLARFDPVTAKAMAVDPGERYQTGAELGAGANAALRGQAPPMAAPTRTAVGEPTRDAVTDPLTGQPLPPPQVPPSEPQTVPIRPQGGSGRRVAIAAAAILAIAVIGVGAYAASGGFKSSSGGGTTIVTNGGGGGGGGGGGSGGGGSGGGGSSNTAADETAILNTLHSYETAFTNHDTTALASLFTPDVIRYGVVGTSCGIRTGIPKVIQAYKQQFASGTGAYTLTDLSTSAIKFLKNGDAVVPLHYTIGGTSSGAVTFALTKSGSSWLIRRINATCG